MRNLFAELRDMLQPGPAQVGTVSSYADGLATITLPGGGIVVAKASVATVGQQVFVQDGVVQGQAVDLTLEQIEI
jgi:hypothetical protein